MNKYISGVYTSRKSHGRVYTKAGISEGDEMILGDREAHFGLLRVHFPKPPQPQIQVVEAGKAEVAEANPSRERVLRGGSAPDAPQLQI